MSKLIIKGGKSLYGDVNIHGAKNSALPILAASVLCRGESIIYNCPNLSDVRITVKILKSIGCRVGYSNSVVSIDSSGVNNCCVDSDLMSEMRSSIIFLSAILARLGCAEMSFPGGCELGARPIDLHIDALKKMGASIKEEDGVFKCSLPKGRFEGADINLKFPSVGATENIILAAVTAKGRTVLKNAAKEPEIVDLAVFLNKCGAKIKHAGSSMITIDGVEKLKATHHKIIPDRIETITYMACVALCRGKANIRDINLSHIGTIIPIFEKAGCKIKIMKNSLEIISDRQLKSVGFVKTAPYPGFPTDAQAPLMAMLTTASGRTVFEENIFENRFRHAKELSKLGTNIKVYGNKAVIVGVDSLKPGYVSCTDLRGGASLVVATLSADGKSTITNTHHIDRGYENIEKTLSELGAKIKGID